MAIVAKATGGSDFKAAPEGTHAAVCVDVIDLGVVASTYNGETKDRHMIQVVWQIAEDRDDGKPHQVKKRYTLSLHEKARLRAVLEAWRGQKFTDEELVGFDLEKLIGVPCMVGVVHNVTNAGTWANVTAVMKLPKGMPPMIPRDYVRVADRNTAATPPPNDFGGDDDNVPF